MTPSVGGQPVVRRLVGRRPTPADAEPQGRDWRAVAPAALCWADWGDDISLFNADTGETHLLSPVPAELLRILCEHPSGQDWLAGRLANLCDCADDAPWREQVVAILHRLAELELIETCSPPALADPMPGILLG